MSKPTERQKRILNAMLSGSRLTLIHGLNPSASLHPHVMGLRLRADDPFHMERKGLIVESRKDWNYTDYRVKED